MESSFKKKLLISGFIAVVAAMVTGCYLQAQSITNSPLSPSHPRYDWDETGRPLPPGVPKEVDTNGRLVHIPMRFTTEAYRKQALDLIIGEANQVACGLNLTEELPITRSNLVEYYVGPFGLNYPKRELGNITTKFYTYGVTEGDKLNYLVVANYDQKCIRCRDRGTPPLSQLDTNAAYQLARQWLQTLSMDVNALNRDCEMHVALSPYWNGLVKLGDIPPKQFVPIYFVWWIKWGNDAVHGGKASVELFLPTKTLLQLNVRDSKYILRKPVVFTNLGALFPGCAPIHTNYPIPTIYMSAPSKN